MSQKTLSNEERLEILNQELQKYQLEKTEKDIDFKVLSFDETNCSMNIKHFSKVINIYINEFGEIKKTINVKETILTNFGYVFLFLFLSIVIFYIHYKIKKYNNIEDVKFKLIKQAEQEQKTKDSLYRCSDEYKQKIKKDSIYHKSKAYKRLLAKQEKEALKAYYPEPTPDNTVTVSGISYGATFEDTGEKIDEYSMRRIIWKSKNKKVLYVIIKYNGISATSPLRVW